ncbi:hypothetical protein [Glutamicibacter arilaitensis]|uniref:hypothetical protein n=1 Tax=Glutamicibacter arilaitensis TaxID=256701 RepID=UPI003FD4C95F
MGQRIRNAKVFLEDTLTTSEQIELAEAILSTHKSMFLTLTKRDATMRLMERHPNMTEGYAASLAEEFFSTELWQSECEKVTDHYWEVECGAEGLCSPLDDWMEIRRLKKSLS